MCISIVLLSCCVRVFLAFVLFFIVKTEVPLKEPAFRRRQAQSTKGAALTLLFLPVKRGIWVRVEKAVLVLCELKFFTVDFKKRK